MSDLITRNLTDQSNNLGQESLVLNQGGSVGFYDANTGQPLNRSVNPVVYNLQNSPLDNSFQINPNQYAVAVGMFQLPGVPENLSNTFGAIAAVTAKSLAVAPNDVYQNGVMSQALLDNVNSLRDATSQLGYNSGGISPPYLHNLMLGAKIFSQTS